jgi:hypothetical protein
MTFTKIEALEQVVDLAINWNFYGHRNRRDVWLSRDPECPDWVLWQQLTHDSSITKGFQAQKVFFQLADGQWYRANHSVPHKAVPMSEGKAILGMPMGENISFIDWHIWLSDRKCHVEYLPSGGGRYLELREWCEPSPNARSPWTPNVTDQVPNTRSVGSRIPNLLEQVAFRWKPLEGFTTKVGEEFGEETISPKSLAYNGRQYHDKYSWVAYKWPKAEWAFMANKLEGCPVIPQVGEYAGQVEIV